MHLLAFVMITPSDWDVESGKQRIAVPADIFLNHVANLHCEGDDGFRREFEKMTLAREKQFSTVVASLPGNREKNRYNNVLPCECSLTLFSNHASYYLVCELQYFSHLFTSKSGLSVTTSK